MPSLQQVRDFVDNRLANFWTNQVIPKQNAYFAAHSRYWQGVILVGLTALPDNPNNGDATVLEVTPNASARPTDQAESWADLGFNFGAQNRVPMAIQIDTYNGPQGWGYVGTVYARWNGNYYTRSQNVGPETHRTIGWRQISPPDVLQNIRDRGQEKK
jgi:hypothetical protein